MLAQDARFDLNRRVGELGRGLCVAAGTIHSRLGYITDAGPVLLWEKQTAEEHRGMETGLMLSTLRGKI